MLFPSSGDLLDPGIEPRSPALQADSLSSEPPGKLIYYYVGHIATTGHFSMSTAGEYVILVTRVTGTGTAA